MHHYGERLVSKFIQVTRTDIAPPNGDRTVLSVDQIVTARPDPGNAGKTLINFTNDPAGSISIGHSFDTLLGAIASSNYLVSLI